MNPYIRWLLEQPTVNSTCLLMELQEGGEEACYAFLRSEGVFDSLMDFDYVQPTSRRYAPPIGLWKFEEMHLPTMMWIGYLSRAKWNLVRTWMAERRARQEKRWARGHYTVGRPVFARVEEYDQLDDHPAISRSTPCGVLVSSRIGDTFLRFERDNGAGRRASHYSTYDGDALAIYSRPHRQRPPFLVLRDQSVDLYRLSSEEDLKKIERARKVMDLHREDWARVKRTINAGNHEILRQQTSLLEEALFY